MYDPTVGKRFEESSNGVDLAHAATTTTRLAMQAFGVLLMLVGGYFGIQIAGDVLGMVRKPATLEATLGDMTKALGLEGAEIATEQKPIAIGRVVACVALFLGYFLAVVIAMRLILAGGRLIGGISSERKAFYQAMKEFSTAVHQEQRK